MTFMSVLLALGAVAGTTLAQGRINIVNNCVEDVYFVASDAQERTNVITLSQGLAFNLEASGTGESIGFSTHESFYSEATAKLVLGYSVNTDNGLVYYSLAADYGNPFAGQSVSITGTAGCPSVSSPNGVTYACADTSSLTVSVC